MYMYMYSAGYSHVYAQIAKRNFLLDFQSTKFSSNLILAQPPHNSSLRPLCGTLSGAVAYFQAYNAIARGRRTKAAPNCDKISTKLRLCRPSNNVSFCLTLGQSWYASMFPIHKNAHFMYYYTLTVRLSHIWHKITHDSTINLFLIVVSISQLEII